MMQPMPELTREALVRFFSDGPVESLRLDGIVETDDARYRLSDSARFWIHEARAAVEGRDGWVAVFRQFDHSKYQNSPEDLLAGWVGPDERARLEAWVADMNRQLQQLLLLKPSST